MTGDRAHSKPDSYWDRAGEEGYGQLMFRSSDVESHVRGRLWRVALDIATTFMGAHVVPPEYRNQKNGADAYVKFLVTKLIPQISHFMSMPRSHRLKQ